jgi:hypothetical protein
MKKNIKTSLLSGVSIMVMVMMLLLLVFNSSFKNAQSGSSRVYVVFSRCIASSKPLPCPDTLASYSILLRDKPGFIEFCFNSPTKDNKQLRATLSGADKSLAMSAIPEIYGEPMIISGVKLYPARVTFTLNQKPLGNLLKFSLIDSSGKTESHFTLVLHLHEKM